MFTVKKLSDVGKDSYIKRNDQGLHNGKIPYGYKNIPLGDSLKERVTVVDEAKAKVMKKVFSMYATGNESLSSIKQELHLMGVNMGIESMRNRLKSRFYLGEILHSKKKEYIQGQHEGIVSEKCFDKVQKILANRKRQSNKVKTEKIKHVTLIGQMVRCGYCGRSVTNDYVRKPKAKYTYLLCAGTKQSKEEKCQNPNCSEHKDVIPMMEELFDNLYFQPVTTHIAKQIFREKSKDAIMELEDRQSSLQRSIKEKEETLDKMELRLIDGKIDEERKQRLEDKVNRDLTFEKSELSSIKKRLFETTELPNIDEAVSDLGKFYRSLSFERKSKFIKLIFEGFVMKDKKFIIKMKKPFMCFFRIDLTSKYEFDGVAQNPVKIKFNPNLQKHPK